MATSSMSIKLLIDTKTQRVLLAEAEKDFVDFLFNLLSLPVGSVIRLLTNESIDGSLCNLYKSVETISERFLIRPNQTREALLRPLLSADSLSQVPLLPEDAYVPRKYYFCSNKKSDFHSFVADDPELVCPCCKAKMTRELTYVAQSKSELEGSGNNNSKEEGFVKGVATYMVMDDLVVKPLSTISSISMLNKFNIKEIDRVEEQKIRIITFKTFLI